MSAPAELLRAMAARVECNAENEFAGCIVVIPPPSHDGSNGDPIEILLIDPKLNARNFWATAKAEVEIAENRFNSIGSVPQLGYR